MASILPPIETQGQFELRAPWAADASVVYTVKAIRTFPELLQADIDIFADFYQPMGLVESDYLADQLGDACIVTLISDKKATINVPDTYISKYPDQDIVPYMRTILAVNLGMVPRDMPLQFVVEQVSAAVSSSFGVIPAISIASAPSTGVVTTTQHEALERVRGAAATNRDTTEARLIAANAEIARLQVIIKDYERSIMEQTIIE